MSTLPDELAPLSVLSASRKSAPEYYAPLTRANDELVRVAAFVALCDRKLLPYKLYEACIAHARYGAVKTKAFTFFQRVWEHGLAAEVAATECEIETPAVTAMAEAWLRGDQAASAAAARRLYLATGNSDLLLQEQNFLYLAGGPSSAIPAGVRNFVLNPHSAQVAVRLFQLCADANRPDLIDGLVDLMTAGDLHPQISLAYSAAASLLRKDFARSREKLGKLSQIKSPNPAIGVLTNKILSSVRTEVLEDTGDFRAAYKAFQELKRPSDGSKPDATSYRTMVLEDAKIDVPALPPDTRTNWFVLAGFPRSGTTLLENALAAHPAIETFEEGPSEIVALAFLRRSLTSSQSEPERRSIFMAARDRYYNEMERARRKVGATVFVDKMPLKSAKAQFFKKIFPDKRYIFSIRHPFDVVLSCFKQDFSPNPAMDNFRTFEDAASFYDFVMSQWFSVYSMDDPRIHYLRYDRLVTEFEPTMRGVLAFLGVEWDDAVLNFAEAAQGRATMTPSYQKVRQGLKIGVQSSWRNYGFLFQMDAAKPLHKWAEFFGYPTQ